MDLLVVLVAAGALGIVVTAQVVLELLVKVLPEVLLIQAILGPVVAVAVLEPWAQMHLMELVVLVALEYKAQ
jgi:hypothetical protein